MGISPRDSTLESVDPTIAGRRNVVGTHNGCDLAAKLRLDKSTISGWPFRGRVPGRFVQLLEPDRLPEIDIWPELHDRGTALALPAMSARYVIRYVSRRRIAPSR